jgi:hypothetical protein
MKPTMQTIDHAPRRTNRRMLPVTDYHYHTIALGGYRGSCARRSVPSFRHISRDYFAGEDRHYFLAEAFVFSAIMLTAAVPLVNGARAVLHLIRAFSGV